MMRFAFLLFLSTLVSIQGREITLDFLNNMNSSVPPVPSSEFLPVGNERSSRVELDGIIYFNTQTIPTFNYEFIQKYQDLVPVQRGLIHTNHPSYDIILSPSRCWRETEDGLYDRCVVTLAVNQKYQNCVENGLLTFLVHSDTLALSPAYFQFFIENCSSVTSSIRGYATGQFTLTSNSNRNQIYSDFLKEVNDKMPTRSIFDLPCDVAQNKCGNGPSCRPPILQCPVWTESDNPLNKVESSSQPVKYYAVAYDSKLYRSPVYVYTEAGRDVYPYPQWYVFPSYMSAGANFVGLTVGALDYKKGCNFPATPTATSGNKCIEELLVRDWISAANAAWTGVTLGNVIDMATGHFDDNTDVMNGDENDPDQKVQFFDSFSKAAKLNFTLNHRADHTSDYPPGVRFINQTPNMFLASVMLEAIVNKVYPSAGGLVGFHFTQVVNPLSLSPTYASPLVTSDSSAQTVGAYGFFSYESDKVRLAQFWGFSDEGKIGNKRLTSRNYFRKVQQSDATDIGLLTGRNRAESYNNGVFGRNLLDTGFCYGAERITSVNSLTGFQVYIAQQSWGYLRMDVDSNFISQTALDALATLIGCPVGTVAVNDASYSVSITTPTDEGNTVTFTIGTTGVPNGYTVFWDLTFVSDNDIDGPMSGQVTINNNQAQVAVAIALDGVTEPYDSLFFNLYTDYAGSVLVQSVSVAVADVSSNANVASISAMGFVTEGNTWVVTGSFVSGDYDVELVGVDAADVSVPLTFTIHPPTGNYAINVPVLNDALDDQTIMTMNIYKGSVLVAQAAAVVFDPSK